MVNNTQSDYHLRYTGNYFDQVGGWGYHSQPITFNEFLSKEESLFMYDSSFMQIPRYIQDAALVEQIEDAARESVVKYIMDEFQHNLLGMQDYRRWATLFRHKCEAITPSFWAQVNMHDLMFAYHLETDESTTTRSNTGTAQRLGIQTVEGSQTGESTTTGNTSTTQDINNTQSTDNSTREANATVIRADDQLTNDLDYNWSDAADNVHEILSRNGDTNQHLESNTESESATNSTNTSSQRSSTEGSRDENEYTGTDSSTYTNKQFMQEKQWAIDTAQKLMPLEWLRQQLRPMFYLVY